MLEINKYFSTLNEVIKMGKKLKKKKKDRKRWSSYKDKINKQRRDKSWEERVMKEFLEIPDPEFEKAIAEVIPLLA